MPLEALGLAPAIGWDRGFWDQWQPGEAGAAEALEVFIEGALRGYREDRGGDRGGFRRDDRGDRGGFRGRNDRNDRGGKGFRKF